MKKLISIVLILLMSCKCLVNLGITTYYQLNKDYIAEILCINKEKPELQCHGKCFLNEKLQQTEQADQTNNQATQKEKIEIPNFLLSELALRLQPPLQASLEHQVINETPTFSLLALGVFHPPQA